MIKFVILVMAALGLASLSLLMVLRASPTSDQVTQEVQGGRSPLEGTTCCCQFKEATPDEALTDKSIYQLGSGWIRDDGQRIDLKQLRGKVRVVAMIFTHCPSSCPRLVEDMKRLESQVPARCRDEVGYLLISLDPERDSPRVLRQYREKMELGPKHWTLLQGHPDDVREIAAVLGVRYKKVGESNIAHANMISVLNREGELVYQQEGLGVEPTATIQAIKRALAAGGAQDGKPAQPTRM